MNFKIKTNIPPPCPVCGEEMKKDIKYLDPICGRKKIRVKDVSSAQIEYKYVDGKCQVTRTALPEGIVFRKMGRKQRRRSVVRGAGTHVLVNGGMNRRCSRNDPRPVWDGESWYCENDDSPEHDKYDLQQERLKIPFYEARRMGLLKKDND